MSPRDLCHKLSTTRDERVSRRSTNFSPLRHRQHRATAVKMSGNVTPARRSRDEYEEDVEGEDEISVDGEEPRSTVRKRARMDDEEDEDEEDEEGDGDADADAEADEEDGEPSSVSQTRSRVAACTNHARSRRTVRYYQIATGVARKAKAQRSPVGHINQAPSYASSFWIS